MSLEPASLDAPVLDAGQLAFLKQILIGNDPQHLHFEAPLWTPHAIGEVIADEFELALDGAKLQACVAQLGLLPPDPLLALDARLHEGYMRWLQSELPRLESRGHSVWWLAEIALVDDAAAPWLKLAGGDGARAAYALAALDSRGRMAWWFCRAPDARTRAEFLLRLMRLAPHSAVLPCGLEDEYAAADALLAPTAEMLLLDPRREIESAATVARAGLFRDEVHRARARRLEGEVLVVRPLPLRVLGTALAVVVVVLLAFGTFARFARTQSASGVLLPASGVVRIAAPQGGRLHGLALAVGADVREGDVIARIASGGVDADGAPLEARVLDELVRARDALDAEDSAAQRQDALERERLAAAAAGAERARRDVAEQHALQAQRQRLAEDSLARSRKLAESGVIAKVQLSELEQQALAGRVQTLALRREADAAGAAADEARNRLAQQPFGATQRADARRQRRADLEQRLVQARQAAGIGVRAPRTGRVAALFVRDGAEVAAGAPLLALVDPAAPLEAELYLPSRAIGFVRAGQRVALKLDAFPYQSFGYAHGTLREIAQAALAPRDLDLPQAGGEPLYVVRVALDAQTIAAYGTARRLGAGMQLSADIVIDRPRVIEWLLEPLLAMRGR